MRIYIFRGYHTGVLMFGFYFSLYKIIGSDKVYYRELSGGNHSPQVEDRGMVYFNAIKI